jgi:hypothetical protein
MDRNTGTYQISFKNIECEKLEDVEIGVLPITKNYKEGDIHNRKYGVNFAGHPLEFRRFFKINLNQLSQIEKQTIQYKNYNIFALHHKIFPTPKNSILTIQLNSRDGTKIFFVNSTPMEYICDVEDSDFPCKFFVSNIGISTTLRMTKFKHINTYLHNIDPGASAFVYEPKDPIFRFKHGEHVYDYDDEEPEIDEVLAEFKPRIVSWDAKLL